MGYLLPWVRLNLWEFELGVVGVHLTYLVTRRCAEHLDDLDQLIHATVSGEYRLAEQQFRHHAACAPHIYEHVETS